MAGSVSASVKVPIPPQEAWAGMKRRVTAIDAEFPTRHVVRQRGMGVTRPPSVSVVFEFGRVEDRAVARSSLGDRLPGVGR